MLSIDEQIKSGALACPEALTPLHRSSDGRLVSDEGRHYPFVGGIPVLLDSRSAVNEYLSLEGGRMVAEYTATAATATPATWRERLKVAILSRSETPAPAPVMPDIETTLDASPGALLLSIGGGPQRAHPDLVNVNIGPFPNVDVVADGYRLPYVDGSVDGCYCDAVLEHLEYPDRAVAEMFRVLRPGGRVFAATPFMQAFHGYPNHYQNFTSVGHRRLFERAGFQVEECSAGVGPTFALADLSLKYVHSHVESRVLRVGLGFALAAAFRRLVPRDRALLEDPLADTDLLPSVTYVLAAKP